MKVFGYKWWCLQAAYLVAGAHYAPSPSIKRHVMILSRESWEVHETLRNSKSLNPGMLHPLSLTEVRNTSWVSWSLGCGWDWYLGPRLACALTQRATGSETDSEVQHADLLVVGLGWWLMLLI